MRTMGTMILADFLCLEGAGIVDVARPLRNWPIRVSERNGDVTTAWFGLMFSFVYSFKDLRGP